jgi:ADP-ribose pyrophosphatase
MQTTPDKVPNVEELGREIVFQGRFAVERLRLRVGRFDGGAGPTVTRDVFRSGDSVALVPYDPARDQVLLIEQFRPGAFLAGANPWLLEVVAGRIEPGETPEAVARRESVEEAGIAPLQVVPAGGFFVSAGDSSQFLHLFCGRVDLGQGGGALHGLVEEHEDIRTLVIPLDEALAWLDAGRIVSSPAVVGLLWLHRQRKILQTQWT